jgi:hypothetical protein
MHGSQDVADACFAGPAAAVFFDLVIESERGYLCGRAKLIIEAVAHGLGVQDVDTGGEYQEDDTQGDCVPECQSRANGVNRHRALPWRVDTLRRAGCG